MGHGRLIDVDGICLSDNYLILVSQFNLQFTQYMYQSLATVRIQCSHTHRPI